MLGRVESDGSSGGSNLSLSIPGWGFMAGVNLASQAWQPLLSDGENRATLRPIVTLGTEEGWRLLEADIDAEQAAFDALGPSVIAISRYWRKQWRERSLLRQAAISPRSLRVGRNDPCPCGSERKYHPRE
jgi:uncharacterized protein YecA (UPF0149 family)